MPRTLPQSPPARKFTDSSAPPSVTGELLAFVHGRLADAAGAGDGGAEARGLGRVGDRSGNQAVFDAAARMLAAQHKRPQALQQRAVATRRIDPGRPQRVLAGRAAKVEPELPPGR